MITQEGALQLIDYLLSLGARGDDNETAIANDTLAGLFDDYRAEIEAAAEQRGMERAAVIAEAEQWPKSHLDAAFRDGNSGPADYNEACTDIARAIRNAKEA
jgi:hypothetical protein